MHAVEPNVVFSPSRLTRRLVLGAAFLGALVVWLPPWSSPAQAQPVTASRSAPTENPTAAAPGTPGTANVEVTREGEGYKTRITIGADDKADRTAEAAGDPGKPSIVIEKNGRKVRVLGIESDAEYDSFNDLVSQEPWLAALIFFSVALVFLLPLLLVLALIWYKMRKNRMLNETMLKLAEKGVVPPADALDAIAGGSARAATAGSALYEHAREARKRTAWSDLRKGVVMGAIGLALTFYSMLDDGSPNGLGLVLLFVGIGYVILWYFEDRHLSAPRPGTGSAPPSNS